MIDLLTDALACFRLTRILTTDRIAQPVRDWAKDHESRESGVGYLVTCDWCTSIHLGVAVVLARRFAPKVWRPVAQALAFSAVTGLIAEHS